MPPATLQPITVVLPRTDQVPDRLGHYRVQDRLGGGGSGQVFRAWDERLGREVAIKLLTGRSLDDFARFAREAHLTARLDHPHIAKILDVGSQPPYLVMQLIDGVTLDRWHGDRLVALRDVARAIHCAHEQGILHRDLKPDNVMVDRNGHAYVLDFGLARTIEPGSSITHSHIVGTPGYMAPEQAHGDSRALDARTDVYGLGATLYHLLADRPPFNGISGYAVLRAVIEDEPELPPGPPDLVAIALQALAKNPADRYATAAAFADELDRYLDGQVPLARPPSVWRRWRNRMHLRPLPWFLGGVLGLTLLASAAAAVLLLARNHDTMRRALAAERELRAADRALHQQAELHVTEQRLRLRLEEADDSLARRLDDEDLALVRASLAGTASTARSIATLLPNDPEPWFILGRAQALDMSDADAITSLRRATAVTIADPELRARIHLALADAALHLAVTSRPWPEVWTWSASAAATLDEDLRAAGSGRLAAAHRDWVSATRLLIQGQSALAREALNQSLEQGGRSENLWLLRALANDQDPAGALADATMAIQRYHSQPIAFLVRAAASRATNRPPDTILKDLEAAQRLQPALSDTELMRSLRAAIITP